MPHERSNKQQSTQVALVGRQWITPCVKYLRAGSAENRPGSAIQDSSLETIGS